MVGRSEGAMRPERAAPAYRQDRDTDHADAPSQPFGDQAASLKLRKLNVPGRET